MNPMRKQQLATVPKNAIANLSPVVQIDNQLNINTNYDVDNDQFGCSSIPNNSSIQNQSGLSKKGIEFAKYFLAYNSWILTNKCITSAMRHNTNLKNNVLQHLINQEFLCEIKGGLKSQNVRSTAIDIWVKCMPPSKNDFTIIQQWNSELSTYGITWDQYASTLSNIHITDDVYMTNAFNEFIMQNYSTISMFIDVSYFVNTKL